MCVCLFVCLFCGALYYGFGIGRNVCDFDLFFVCIYEAKDHQTSLHKKKATLHKQFLSLPLTEKMAKPLAMTKSLEK